MRRPFAAAVLVLVAACSPSLDWREVPVGSTGLMASFPCKPDTVERKVPFAPGTEWTVRATGCEAAGASFAVLSAEVPAAELDAALDRWRAAHLAAFQARQTAEAPIQPPGALELPASRQVHAQGRRPDGQSLQSRSAYFARGHRVFQAVVYAESVTPEATDPFFAGLRFR